VAVISAVAVAVAIITMAIPVAVVLVSHQGWEAGYQRYCQTQDQK
jgi:hypothetical protein